jgi:hypothetical protein
VTSPKRLRDANPTPPLACAGEPTSSFWPRPLHLDLRLGEEHDAPTLVLAEGFPSLAALDAIANTRLVGSGFDSGEVVGHACEPTTEAP